MLFDWCCFDIVVVMVGSSSSGGGEIKGGNRGA